MDHSSPASTCTISDEVQKMETEPEGGTTIIPEPDPNADEETIDHVLDILNKYSHPFILAGLVALRWMGCSSCVDAGFDLVLRARQLPAIVTSLVESGYWTTFDGPKALEVFKSDAAWQDLENLEDRKILKYLYEAVAVLKWEGIEGIEFSYMRLWTDEIYHIDVDASPLVEVPELYPWNPFLVEKEFHPAFRRDDGWFCGPPTLDDRTSNDGADGIFSTSRRRLRTTCSPISQGGKGNRVMSRRARRGACQ